MTFYILRCAAGHLQPGGPAAAAPLQGGRELRGGHADMPPVACYLDVEGILALAK